MFKTIQWVRYNSVKYVVTALSAIIPSSDDCVIHWIVVNITERFNIMEVEKIRFFKIIDITYGCLPWNYYAYNKRNMYSSGVVNAVTLIIISRDTIC